MKYFREARIEKYAKEYGWELITPANMKDKFMEMVRTMDMAFSYKPVLLSKAKTSSSFWRWVLNIN